MMGYIIGDARNSLYVAKATGTAKVHTPEKAYVWKDRQSAANFLKTGQKSKNQWLKGFSVMEAPAPAEKMEKTEKAVDILSILDTLSKTLPDTACPQDGMQTENAHLWITRNAPEKTAVLRDAAYTMYDIGQIKEAVGVMGRLVSQGYRNMLAKTVSDADRKINDLEHYIEFRDFDMAEGYALAEQIRILRKERRAAKDQLLVLTALGPANTSGIISAANQCSALDGRTFTPKMYSSMEEIKNILAEETMPEKEGLRCIS